MERWAGSAVMRVSLLVIALAFASPQYADSRIETPKELNQAGVAALSAGEYEKALSAFNRAAQLAPNDAGIAFNIGLTYLRMNKYPQAMEPLRRAVADPVLSAQAHFLLGVALYQTGQLDAAATELERVRSDPAYTENVLYMLEECYRRTR